MENYKFIGKSVPKVDSEVKATGEARYTVDVSFPNMLREDFCEARWHMRASLISIQAGPKNCPESRP